MESPFWHWKWEAGGITGCSVTVEIVAGLAARIIRKSRSTVQLRMIQRTKR